MELITFKAETNLIKSIDKALKNSLYSTKTELIRDSIRRRLTELEKEEAIKTLIKLKGSLKGKRIRSDEEANQIMEAKLKKLFLD